MLAEMGSIIVDMVKVGAVTIVTSKATKSFGQKEIAEIISGIGWLSFGVGIARLFVPFYKGCLVIDENTQGLQEVIKMLFSKEYFENKVRDGFYNLTDKLLGR